MDILVVHLLDPGRFVACDYEFPTCLAHQVLVTVNNISGTILSNRIANRMFVRTRHTPARDRRSCRRMQRDDSVLSASERRITTNRRVAAGGKCSAGFRLDDREKSAENQEEFTGIVYYPHV